MTVLMFFICVFLYEIRSIATCFPYIEIFTV